MLFNFVVAVAVAAGFATGGHHHAKKSAHGTEVLFQEKSASAVEESDAVQSCPHGFKMHGKQCIKFLTAEPVGHCPAGFKSFDGSSCVAHVEKVFQCPKDSVQVNGACVRSIAIDAVVECPHGFKLASNGHECFRHLPNPKRFFCPPQTVKRGDVCIRRVVQQPEHECPIGYTKTEDKRCKVVETFDCSSHGAAGQPSHKHHKHLLRQLGAKKHSVVSKEAPPVEKQHVVSQVCEKLRIVPARKVCPHGSVLNNKECSFDKEFPLVEKSMPKIEEVVKARFVCPEGHLASARLGRNTLQCVIKEDAPIRGFCPDHSEPHEGKCAIFSPTLFTCPESFAVKDGHECVKQVIAPATVEYNVRFKCQGKNCDSRHKSHS